MAAHDPAVLARDGDFLMKVFQAQGLPREAALDKLRESHPATYRAYAKTQMPHWTDDQARTQLARLAKAYASRHGGSVSAAMTAILKTRPDLMDALRPDRGAGRAKDARTFARAYGLIGRR